MIDHLRQLYLSMVMIEAIDLSFDEYLEKLVSVYVEKNTIFGLVEYLPNELFIDAYFSTKPNLQVCRDWLKAYQILGYEVKAVTRNPFVAHWLRLAGLEKRGAEWILNGKILSRS